MADKKMDEKKTHYRRVFKSDHLGVADLEDFLESGSNLVFTIDHVNQEYDVMVAGRKGNFNIAYFKEGIKPLVLNATNSKTMKNFAKGSAFVEDWKGIIVRLYIDYNVRLMNETVGGVRISPDAPQVQNAELIKKNKMQWKNAKDAYLRDGNLDAVRKKLTVSPELEKELIKEANADVA